MGVFIWYLHFCRLLTLKEPWAGQFSASGQLGQWGKRQDGPIAIKRHEQLHWHSSYCGRVMDEIPNSTGNGPELRTSTQAMWFFHSSISQSSSRIVTFAGGVLYGVGKALSRCHMNAPNGMFG